MSAEPALVAAVMAVCPNFYWDEADENAPRPYVVAQAIGGVSMQSLDGLPISKRNTAMRITTWAATRKESTELARRIEDALAVVIAFQAAPQGEPVSLADPDTKLRGSQQTFSIWSDRT